MADGRKELCQPSVDETGDNQDHRSSLRGLETANQLSLSSMKLAIIFGARLNTSAIYDYLVLYFVWVEWVERGAM